MDVRFGDNCKINELKIIINFKGSYTSIAPLYEYSQILKLKDIILLNNCQFVYNQINNNLPNIFNNYFTQSNYFHEHNTRGLKLTVPTVNTTMYGTNSITMKAIKDWNCIQAKIDNIEITHWTFIKSAIKSQTWLNNNNYN